MGIKAWRLQAKSTALPFPTKALGESPSFATWDVRWTPLKGTHDTRPLGTSAGLSWGLDAGGLDPMGFGGHTRIPQKLRVTELKQDTTRSEVKIASHVV